MTTAEVSRRQDASEGAIVKTGSALDIATTRAAQEVQAAMVIAKRFPRDETAAIARILQSCKRKGLAEASLYSYPRGDTTVTGPSIRLAEAMAQAWGNLDFGIIELEQKHGESHVMAYAWDLETNTRQTKIFTVPHKRYTKRGSYTLDDPRDIYEVVANQGARRLRACILGVIPGDVQDAAIFECENTMRGDGREPLIDRARKMVVYFQGIGVTQKMLEARLRHGIDSCSETELVGLKKIAQSLKDNMAGREEFFPNEAAESADGGSKADRLADKLKPAEPKPQTAAEKILDPNPPTSGRPKAKPIDPPHTDDAPEIPTDEGDPRTVEDQAEEFVQAPVDELRKYLIALPPKLLVAARKMAGVTAADYSDATVKAVSFNAKLAQLNA